MTRSRRSRERGVALLLVLWVFMILGVLSLDFSRYMRDDAMATVNFADSTRGYFVASAGLNLALFERKVRLDDPLAPENPEGDPDEEPDPFPADGEWHEGKFAGATYQVRVIDESSRLPLNHLARQDREPALKAILSNLMLGPDANVQGVSGRDAKAVDELVGAIIDWADTNSEKALNGAEKDWYISNDLPEPKNYKFTDVSELLRVRGVTPELYYGSDGLPGLRDVLTVFSSEELGFKLNVKYVTSPVIQVLLRKTPEEAEELLAIRDENHEAFVAQFQAELNAVAPGAFPEDFLIDGPAQLVSVEARADTSQPRNQAHIGAVVDLAKASSEYYDVIRWYDRVPWAGKMPTGEFGEPGA